MKIFAILAIFASAIAIAAAPPSVNVTIRWNQPATCAVGFPSCTYVVSRAPLAGSNCPSPALLGYTPLNSASPTNNLSYVDSVPKNSSWCYIVQTKQMIAGQMNTSVASGPLKKVKVH